MIGRKLGDEAARSVADSFFAMFGGDPNWEDKPEVDATDAQIAHGVITALGLDPKMTVDMLRRALQLYEETCKVDNEQKEG